MEYVGHPLLEAAHATASRAEFCRRYSLDPARPIIALLPGSRKKEIHYHLPAMLEAARTLRIANCEMRNEGPRSFDTPSFPLSPKFAIHNSQFVIPVASTVDPRQIAQILNRAHNDIHPYVRLIDGETFNTLFHSFCAVVASGTATVEVALANA